MDNSHLHPNANLRTSSLESFSDYQATPTLTPDPTNRPNTILATQAPPLGGTPEQISEYWRLHWEERARGEYNRAEEAIRALNAERQRADLSHEALRNQHHDATRRYKDPKLPSPDRFYGRTRSTILVTRWLSEAKRWCLGNNYDPQMWVYLSSAYLKEFAQTWYDGQPELQGHGVVWEHFEKAMHKEYDDELSQTKLLDTYHNLAQENIPGRSVSVYNAQFRRLASEIPDTLLPKSLRLYHYLSGLMLRTRQDMERTNPQTVEEAMFQAARIENTQRNATHVPTYDSYIAGQSSLSRPATDNIGHLTGRSYGDPMDLSNIEDSLPEFPDSIEDLWALEEDDPERYYETVESLYALRPSRGRFRGRGRGGQGRGRASDYGRSYGQGRDSRREGERDRGMSADRSQIKCYTCGKPGHRAFECSQRADTQRTVNQVTDDISHESGNERGRG